MRKAFGLTVLAAVLVVGTAAGIFTARGGASPSVTKPPTVRITVTATDYRFASPLALAWADTVIGDGPGGGTFAPMTYRIDSLSIGVRIPLHERVALRVFDLYERGRISDWHYLGFDATRAFDHRVYTDGGPQSYDANLVGLLLDVRL